MDLIIEEVKLSPKTAIIVSQNTFKDISLLKSRLLIKNAANEAKTFSPAAVIVLDDFPDGKTGLTSHAMKILGINGSSGEQKVKITEEIRIPPASLNYLKSRMKGVKLQKNQVDEIIHDITTHKLSIQEKTAFILTQHFDKFDMEEIEHVTRAIANSGEIIDFGEDYATITDKHSLGGVPGNKVTLLIVPIIASMGLMIPKTSSRAITSPSGTADTMESFNCEVSFNATEIVEITKQVGGMICWGGALNLAPADDILIHDVEFPLGINPQSTMLASIMAKKLAMGVNFLVIDMPTGKGTKVPNSDEGLVLAREFSELGRRLGIRVENGLTFGGIPVGHAIGPGLEAREGLSALKNPKSAPSSLIEKSTALAGILLEMVGKAQRGKGQDMALHQLYSGVAYEKFKEMLEAQNGDPNIKPEDITVGKNIYEWVATVDGWIVDIDNKAISAIAKAAGAPQDKTAGIYFIKKKEAVKRGEPVLRIHASSEDRLKSAINKLTKRPPITIEGMLLGRL
ncbi:MAG: AMP phosphorylase [Candidatus Hodarchaeales archaeon]